MYIPFEQLPPQARIWIYQADRTLQDQEIEEINKKAERFVTAWTSHGQTLQASAKIFYNRFLVLATDEAVSSPSGCSIDASVNFIRELEQTFGLSFFDRTKLLFMQNNQPEAISLADLKTRIAEGALTENTLFFDNLVQTTAQLKGEWLKPAGESWLAKYF